jgi:hypothetical protein
MQADSEHKGAFQHWYVVLGLHRPLLDEPTSFAVLFPVFGVSRDVLH